MRTITPTSTTEIVAAAEASGLELFDLMNEYQYEQVVLCHEPATKLRAIIVIHNTTLGPALGGIRMWPYESERDAIVDCMRLARGMTFKAAVAGLNLGGGKTVVIGDPRKDKSEALFRALGRFVDTLGGRYIAAEDVGTATEDMDYVAMETPFVTGIDHSDGGSGDPSPMTALGVFHGIRAAAKKVYGTHKLEGRRISLQGCGHVGSYLAQHLADAGAILTVTDIHEDNVAAVVKATGASAVAPNDIWDVPVEIFAPCALGGIITPDTIERLSAKGEFKIIAGAANNVLDRDTTGHVLHERGILYAPDYVINAGGLINVSEELGGYNHDRATKKVTKIYDNLMRIFELAVEKDIPPHEAAQKVALERIAMIRPISDVYTGRARTSWQHKPIALQS
ncbi:MAG: Glu/Leu/Phe/Val dehydrogenase [Thermoleophilia bacterium]|nr:Glu/Leu/Phe/Val dehydrogenase [Thermoleophilia bacterium]